MPELAKVNLLERPGAVVRPGDAFDFLYQDDLFARPVTEEQFRAALTTPRVVLGFSRQGRMAGLRVQLSRFHPAAEGVWTIERLTRGVQEVGSGPLTSRIGADLVYVVPALVHRTAEPVENVTRQAEREQPSLLDGILKAADKAYGKALWPLVLVAFIIAMIYLGPAIRRALAK